MLSKVVGLKSTITILVIRAQNTVISEILFLFYLARETTLLMGIAKT